MARSEPPGSRRSTAPPAKSRCSPDSRKESDMRRSIHAMARRSGSGASSRPDPGPAAPRGQDAPERVKLVLHRAIVSGTIPGGTRLVRASIAREFAAGPRQVRDALRELAAEGLVRMEEDTGDAVVRELCRSDLEDIYQVRMLL